LGLQIDQAVSVTGGIIKQGSLGEAPQEDAGVGASGDYLVVNHGAEQVDRVGNGIAWLVGGIASLEACGALGKCAALTIAWNRFDYRHIRTGRDDRDRALACFGRS
jgi:hypothetical protein